MDPATLSFLLPFVSSLLKPRTTTSAPVEEKKDYTVYWIIGAFSIIFLIILIIAISKQKK